MAVKKKLDYFSRLVTSMVLQVICLWSKRQFWYKNRKTLGIVPSGAAWKSNWGGPKPGIYVTRWSNSFSSISSGDRGTWLQGSASVVAAVLSALGVMCVHVKWSQCADVFSYFCRLRLQVCKENDHIICS